MIAATRYANNTHRHGQPLDESALTIKNTNEPGTATDHHCIARASEQTKYGAHLPRTLTLTAKTVKESANGVKHGDRRGTAVRHRQTTEGVPGIVGGFPKGEENRGGSRGPDSRLESGSKNPNRETTTMKRKYEKKGHPDKAGLRELLAKDGRDYLLPLVNVFALAGGALDQIIDVIGRAAIEAVLDISAADVAGEKQPGKERKGAGAAYHGRQRGRVYLADRAVRVEKPRLRSPGEGEIAIPAYEALRRPSGLGERMLELLLAGLSTRSYGKAIGEMAETAGVSKSSVSRQAAEAAGERLKELAERRLDDRDYLIVYVDGIQFGGHHVLAALGVDDKGNKRVLGVREGASENAVVALGLLESLVERGLDPGRARLFVLDGSKALHKAVGQVFGSACLVQRCRNHKMRNVTGHLPKELHDQASAVLRAAWKLGAKDGKARIEQFASWVEKQHPDAAGSLREGLGEMFTVREIGLTPALRRCLGTTNVIDNAHSGMRRRTGRVTRWRDGSMAVRWAAAAFMDAEKNYRRIMGYKDLWILKAHLDELGTPPVDGEEVAA